MLYTLYGIRKSARPRRSPGGSPRPGAAPEPAEPGGTGGNKGDRERQAAP